nr:phosphopantetheine-binding domain-containing pro [uncultured bacterium]
MKQRDVVRLADLKQADGPSLTEIGREVRRLKLDPVDCLLQAAAAGLLPTRQPPARLADDAARNRYLLRHLERRDFRVRPARNADLPALMLLERHCWAPALRTSKEVLKRRIARYPQGQLVLLIDDTIAGVIYSQRIKRVEKLDGTTAAEVDALHRPSAKTVQLLAINVLPEMQQRALGDQLLEFMLIYRSLQERVEQVVAITRCKSFKRGQALADYIRQRNAQGVLADPILRFHELHGASIERVMPGYRPGDTENEGCGVLVRYDIRRRRRNPAKPAAVSPAGATKTRAEIRDELRDALTACLGDKSAFAPDRPLMEMGLDSADLLALSETIAQRYGLELSPTVFFQHDTADKLAGYLGDQVAAGAAPRAEVRSNRPKTQQARTQDVAIVGMACRLPGGIHTPDDLWTCLEAGRSVIGSLPAGRFTWPDGIDPTARHRGIDRGGFLDDVAAFDAPFFRISPAEAETMDPQQRILLELCWHAMEHAGCSLAGSRTGVFIGASGSDYARLLDQSGTPTAAHSGTGNAMAVLANRLSYFYDLRGPSLLLDTACSSSLVAVHEAVRAIASGECAQALVGGINLILHPATSVAYYKAGMLSRDGLCRSFDQTANGYVRSEGAVVLLLKPLQAALADHDRVHAVIKGTACNHGGQVSGLTVPNPDRQAELLQDAWRAAGIDPRAIGYVEAHGTGTPLGDPIEVQGITQALFAADAAAAGAVAAGAPPGGRALGSVKTNLGHLEAAAGLAGLLKTVLCLRHRQLPASLHFRQLNPHIDLSGLHVVDRLQQWLPPADGAPRLAGVSSFGSGGTNAHVVVAEHLAATDKADAAPPLHPFARHRYWVPGAAVPQPVAHQPSADEPAATLLAPIWHPVDARPTDPLDSSARVLVVGANDGQQQAIRSLYPAAQAMEIDPAASIDALTRQVHGCGDLDHVIWVAPPSSVGDDAVEAQRAGLLHVFRLTKALLRSYAERKLTWTAITWRTQAVHDRDANPAHAGVHGFLGALAQEVPRWSMRLLDLESEQDWPVAEALRLRFDANADVLVRRGPQWFRRAFGPVTLPDALPPYRQNGVYVVIGGAGGIGAAWTRHVIARYQAQVIWIGRRERDAAIEAKLKALAEVGPAPEYIAADAANRDSLQAAYAKIKQAFPAVHGVIHAAVGAFDRGIAEMDEAQFRDILSVKIDASVHVARAFATEPLDFLLYFSSVVALEKNGGLSGYAAGGAFQDAFALHLRGQARVINWGHWAIGTGAAVSDATKARLQHGGIVPIRPEEAFAALDRLLSAPFGQLALLKSSRLDALPFVDRSRSLQVYADTVAPAPIAPIAESWKAEAAALGPSSIFNNVALEVQLLPLFAATLQPLGADVPQAAPAHYRPWLAASRNLLAERGLDQPVLKDCATAWREWELAKGALGTDLAAAIDLAEACLRALPDILAGRARATDILFPGASMRRVEGIYRDNAVADYFNQVLAASLVAAIESRLARDPDARLRLLEVGAGTGGTTAMVLRQLAPYRRNLAEYAYTDVSKAFLFHAEEHFVAAHPYVRPHLLDVERPFAGQGLDAGAYDVVIATNVLHATRDIRRTLATCKAALRQGGLLLLNELSGRSLFAHLTFGLLEGWWLPEDRSLRLPDSPGLAPESWQTVLRQEGFAVAFPVPESHGLGQQVIVAESDGVVWRQAAAPATKPARQPAPSAAVAPGTAAALKAAANAHVRKLVAQTLRMDANDVDVREPLETYGIDSILVVQITEALRETFPDVRSTLLFECQTIDALSEHFVRHSGDQLARLAGMPAVAPAVAVKPARAPVTAREPVGADDPIAVIGMSCRFPQAEGVEAYWQVLKSGQNCIREVPDRWPLENFFHPDPDEAIRQGKSYSKWGGFLDGVTEFDPHFFNILPREAAAIDPQERLFLQTAWAALEDAGYTRERLAKDFRQKLGVFVGITRTGFDLFGPELWRRGETVYPHTSFSSVANRLSYFLNARGPSVPVDTMCSSSLTAIHQACQSLRGGECELAIAGGVNVYLHPSGYVTLSASRMLSRDGVCRSFGKGGNGFVPGEGVAAVLLKPLSRAIADNDVIYAAIRATHVNHGGKTNGYTVPNPHAQAELVREALQKAGVDARAIGYVEAHGTGTQLGDPIEVAGLTQAFRHFTPDRGFCALGSAKSNIGHLEAAAGIAGFIKAVLQLRHGQLVPSLHAAELNPSIDFAATPFVVQQSLADWERGESPRLAAISSFGAGGANAHVIVEEYRDQHRDAGSPAPHMVVLSTRSEERLKAYAARLHDFIVARVTAGTAPALSDLAYTLQVGREPMDHRLGLIASSLEDARDKLKRYLDGMAEDVQVGHARQHKDIISAVAADDAMQGTIATWFARGDHARLLTLWTKGLTIDWEDLHRTAARGTPRRISLPTYPFATDRYWLPIGQDLQRKPDPAPVARAKPNTIVLRDLASVSTTFDAHASRKPVSLRLPDSPVAPPSAAEGSADARLAVHDLGDGVLSITPEAADASTRGGAALTACIEWVGQRAGAKVLVLRGLDRMFPGDGPAMRAAAQVLAGSPMPTVAIVAQTDAPDATPLTVACDLAVAGEDSALDAARDIARASAPALAALKRHLSQAVQLPVNPDRLDAGFSWPAQRVTLDRPQRVPLTSEVVTVECHHNGVVVVRMCDRSARNTSSAALVHGVLEAFEHIRATPDYKVVVLTGYENYFACGGTKEGLIAIQSGKARFTDEQSYAAPLACEIPVIAAMQGHAIGAGWAMGLFCDVAIYAEESVYQSPYMLYGFTPGAGSTLIFPHRLGRDLSREVLLTAREFRGRELKDRGVVPVLPRGEVLDSARALASHLARSSCAELKRRKRQSSQPIRAQLPQTFAQELALHDRTFVGNADVIAGLARHFRDIASVDQSPSHALRRAGAAPQVAATLRQMLADELSLPPDQIDDDMAFVDIGIDSISAVTFVRKINKQFTLAIAATKIYNYPTLGQFAAFVASHLESAPAERVVEASAVPVQPVFLRAFPFDRDDAEARPAPATSSPAPHGTPQPIAIIGMAGQFPAAENVQQFWRNLVQGRDCITEISSRWSIDAYHDPDRNAPGKTVCRHMGALDDVDMFDPLFFNLSPSEAEYMDPQQRLFLQNSWRCIEDAGYDPTALSGSQCGVFAGCAVSDYGQLMAGQPPTAQGLIGESVAMLPARISYLLNLQGPCLALDTACSASLVAIASACDSLVLGNCDLALAGGVYVINGPDIHVKMSQAGMLSADGRCFTFDQRANGFVPGEGVGVLLLKRLADAQRDGDDIRAVIRGWGVNQDGKTNGITAPNQDAQARLETGVYRKFGINPEHIQLVEAHGTGTKLGDPIEVEALRAAFGEFTDRQQFCALGSAKSNIGHLATAAGVAGVIKSVLALQHRQLPPTINFAQLNEHIALQASPFYVNTRCEPWPDTSHARMVAVSSFGFSGTNAHMVLEASAQRSAATGSEPSTILLPLSAKSREQLAVYAQAVSDFLADATQVSLADIAWTFQTGRPAMNHRLAVIANTADELRARLNGFAATGATGPYCHAGEAGKAASQVKVTSTPKDLAGTAARWVRGEPIDWKIVRPGPAQRRHGLPTYPFARERYWIPGAEDGQNSVGISPRDNTLPQSPANVANTDSPSGRVVWRASALATELDWQDRLRHWLGRQILVVHTDNAECQAFRQLLTQLKQSGGHANSAEIYCVADELDAVLAARRPDCVLFLCGTSGRSDMPAMVRHLKSARAVAAVVILMHADAAMAEQLGDLVARDAPGQPACLLISQSDGTDLQASMQRLFREWLAFGAQGEPAAFSEIHYEGGERLSRIQDVRPDGIALIRKDWRPKDAEPREQTAERGTVLVLVNPGSAEIATLLAPDDFARVILVSDTDTGQQSIDFSDPEAARAGAQMLLDRYADITHVIDLADLSDTGDTEDDPWGKVAFYQTLVAGCQDLSIAYVTRELQTFRSGNPGLAGAKIAGLMKMLSADYRHIDARHIDIDQATGESPAQLRDILLGEFDSALRETEICYRAGQRFAPALSAVAASDGAALPIAEDGVYVVSGGTNGVGLEIARYLAAKGCRKLVLMGITPLPPKGKWAHAVEHENLTPYVRNKLRALIELEKTLDQLDIYTGPLTDQPALRRHFMKVRATLGPIRGVVHAAAVYSDARTPGFADKDLARMRQVFAPKAEGLENLHAILEADPLDFFVSLSSMTGLVPHLARGASDYAMANSFVEFFTAYQNQAGDGGCTTIAWSDWNDTGAIRRIGAEKASAIRDTFDALGLRTFSSAEGRVLLEHAMARRAGGRVSIGYLDRRRFEQAAPQLLHARPDFRGEASARTVTALKGIADSAIREQVAQWKAAKRAGAQVSVREILDVISLDEIKQLDPILIHEIHALLFAKPELVEAPQPADGDTAQVIASAVKEVLKLKSLDSEQPFQNYGLDSISATILAARLEKRLKREVAPKWLIEYPTVEMLARHLMTQDGQLDQRAQ